MNNKAVIITGPTASGKSSAALCAAKKHNGVIISADSMQIYRSMDIGSAKPTADETACVEHRMIDILDIGEQYSVADYKQRAKREIASVLSSGRLPIICGGTGLYIDALYYNNEYCQFDCPPEIRESLSAEIRCIGGEAMLKRLAAVDPESAAKLHPKDHKRIVRALEVYYATGSTLTEFNAQSRSKQSEYDFLNIVLCFRDREKLYERINSRVDKMVADGLIEETKRLISQGLLESATASQAIGYKELCGYLSGNETLEEALELLKRRTRNYAKRQITWFNRYTDAVRIYKDECEDVDDAVEREITHFLNKG